MNKKIVALTTAVVLSLSVLGGCGKKEEEATTEAQSYSVNLTENSMIDDSSDMLMSKDGKILSDLNGEWVEPEIAKQRYVAIMVNNIIDAMPQSGVERADVIYEMLEEGGITRLMAIFLADYTDVQKIGPVRSARHYYDRKALEYDAIFAHWGQSIYAQHEFEHLKDLDQLDMNGKDGEYGFRASDRVAPHNAYTSGENIKKAIEADGFDTKKSKEYKKMFNFNLEEKPLEGGKAANKITTAYNEGRKPWFEYDSESGLYKRFQYGEPQIDAETANLIQ